MSALLSAPIGFIGLGVMGEPMCAHLTARAKGPVLVHDLRDDAVSRAVAVGARAAGSLAGLRTQAQVVFLCLADGEATWETCRALSEPASEVRLVIDCGTTSVALTQSLADELAECGIEFADAPMARMRQAARAGSLSFMVGAAPEVFTRIEPLLATMGTDILHCGPVGSGQIVKTMNNMVLFETVHALALAVRVCRKLGVDPRTLLTALGHGSADSRAVRVQGLHLVDEHFPTGAFPADYARKDLALAHELAAATGTDDALLAATGAALARATEGGRGDAYYPVLIDFLGTTPDSAQGRHA